MDIIRTVRDYLSAEKKAAQILRDEGREELALYHAVGEEAKRHGKGWPTVLEDNATHTTTVPQSYEGLLAFVCSWDSLLLDEELEGLKAVVDRLVPMGLKYQEPERQRRKARERMIEEIKTNQPERWDRMQGWKV
jgi:hypothetical protein